MRIYRKKTKFVGGRIVSAEIDGGMADGMSAKEIADIHGVPEDTIKKQIDMGTEIEMEHVNSRKVAREIAMDHLVEMPDYYTKLKKMESET